MTVEFDIPIRLRSGLNCREHWAVKAKRVREERLATAVWMRPILRLAPHQVPPVTLAPPFVVTITRVGPRRMDDDNVAGGAKGVRDEIARQLGVNDGDTDAVRFVYGQRLGPYGVRVRIQAGGAP